MKKVNTQTGGVSFASLLTLLFIALKLCHVIDWSWWWVLAPLWLPVTAFMCLCLAVFISLSCFELAKHFLKKHI
jgi:hypothetical protein